MFSMSFLILVVFGLLGVEGDEFHDGNYGSKKYSYGNNGNENNGNENNANQHYDDGNYGNTNYSYGNDGENDNQNYGNGNYGNENYGNQNNGNKNYGIKNYVGQNDGNENFDEQTPLGEEEGRKLAEYILDVVDDISLELFPYGSQINFTAINDIINTEIVEIELMLNKTLKIWNNVGFNRNNPKYIGVFKMYNALVEFRHFVKYNPRFFDTVTRLREYNFVFRKAQFLAVALADQQLVDNKYDIDD